MKTIVLFAVHGWLLCYYIVLYIYIYVYIQSIVQNDVNKPNKSVM